MSVLTWLHLSDWHQRGKNFNQQLVRDALIKDIKERTNICSDLKQIDFVIFSGDVAHAGKPEEYRAVIEYLFDPVLEATGLHRNQLFIVPGNHDLDRDAFKLLPPALHQPFTSEEQVQEWLTNDKQRRRLLEPFEEFQKFVTEYTGQNESTYGTMRRVEIGEKKVVLLGFNSALMCARHQDPPGEVQDYGYLIVGEPQIYDALKQAANTDVVIAVLHHPFEWLSEFDRNRIQERLARDCHFVLQGHQHTQKVNVVDGTSGDCVMIPAGAIYESRTFPNSYNFVHVNFVTGQGTVYLRAWNNPKSEWMDDTYTYKGGKYNFRLPKQLRHVPPPSDNPRSGIETPSQLTVSSFDFTKQKQIVTLPNPRTLFVGRADEVRAVTQLLRNSDTKLVTLYGPSGVGKTRLAIEVARALQDDFPDGICFVELAPITEPSLVFITIADNLRIRQEGDPASLLQEVLGQRKILLLLDNFEGVMKVAANLGKLLADCQLTKALVTSQAKLNIGVEETIEVKPLSFPEPSEVPTVSNFLEYGAIALFVERARRADPEFKITPENAPAIVSICKYLYGLPAWLELTAASTRIFTAQEIQQRLAKGSWLVTVPRDIPDRLKTPEAMYEWSQHLLDPAEQVLCRRLAVFIGGCTVEAAEAVSPAAGPLSSDVAGGIAKLVEMSVLALERQPDGSRRFRMSEPIRWCAAKRLEDSGERDKLQDAHAHYYLQFAEQLTSFGTSKPEERQARLEAEHHNLRAAIEWSLKRGQVDIALRLGNALWRFWRAAHLSEGRRLLSDILANPAASDSAQPRAQLLGAAGKLALAQGDVAHAHIHLQDSLRVWRELRDEGGAAEVLSALSSLAFDTGKDEEAARYAQESLAKYERLTDESLRLHGMARAHGQLGGVAYIQGFTVDRSLAAECFISAREHFIASRNLWERGSSKIEAAHSRQDLAYVALGEYIVSAQGDLSEAESLLKAGLAIFNDMKDAYRIAAARVGLAAVAVAVGQSERAAELLGSAAAVRASHGLHLVRFLKPVHDWTHEQLRGRLAATA